MGERENGEWGTGNEGTGELGNGQWGNGEWGNGGAREEMGDGGRGRGRSARFYKPQLCSLYNIYF
jgi:hypothetical protein